MRSNLRRHPKVVRLASASNADRLRVVGGLHAVWCLFDEHSEDGCLYGYTPSAIDEEIGWPGFCNLLISIGWVESDGNDGLSLPEFDTHNGASAKRRAMEADRKRAERAAPKDHPHDGSNLSASHADKKRTREEESREEYSVPIGTGAVGAGKKPRTAAEQRKSDLWRSIKLLLVESGESKDLKAAGAIVTQAIAKFDEPTALEAIEATLHKRPAGVIAYIEAACQQAAGQRLNKQEVLEAGNLAAAERFAMED
jgi:hypothetical protein